MRYAASKVKRRDLPGCLRNNHEPGNLEELQFGFRGFSIPDFLSPKQAFPLTSRFAAGDWW